MTHRSFLRPAVSLCAAIALSVVALAAVPGTAPQQPPATPPGQEQAREGSGTISSVGGGKPKLAVPDFLAATPDAESKAIAADDRPGAVGRPRLRARVLHGAARHLRVDPGAGVDRRGAVRSLARARGRGPGHRRRAQDGDRRHRPGAAVQRRRPDRRVLEGIQRHGGQPARLRAHDRRRDPQAAAQPDRRRPDQAHLLVRSRRRADEGHGLQPRDQGDLHRRLRRRQPAPDHGEPLAEHQPGVVERRQGDRLHLVPARQLSRHLHPAHLRRHAAPVAGARHRPHPQLPAGVVAGRHEDRVHDQPRRQPGDLRRWTPAASNLRRITRHPGIDSTPTWSPAGNQIALHVRSLRLAADLHRRRRWAGPAAAHHDGRELGRSRHLVAVAVQRDRLRRPLRARLRHQDLRRRRRARRERSRAARGRTRARPSRRPAATSPSRRPAPATSRSSSSAATATV